MQIQNYIVNPKIQYNYSNFNCIPELLLAYSGDDDGEFLLEWCEYFGQPQMWYIRKLCTTASCGTSVMYHCLSL